jgi:N-ethylmaleimide reductase
VAAGHRRPDVEKLEGVPVQVGGLADLISYGVLFLANPDLPRRLAQGGPFNEPDRATFYGGDAHGYLDYPTLEQVAAH